MLTLHRPTTMRIAPNPNWPTSEI